MHRQRKLGYSKNSVATLLEDYLDIDFNYLYLISSYLWKQRRASFAFDTGSHVSCGQWKYVNCSVLSWML